MFRASDVDFENAARISSAQVTMLRAAEQDDRWSKRASFPGLWDPSPLFPTAIQPWPLFVSGAVVDALADSTQTLVTLLERCARRRARGGLDAASSGLGSRYRAQLDLLAETERSFALALRGDFIESVAGFRCLELNVTGGLGGWQLGLIRDRWLEAAPARAMLAALPRATLMEPFSQACRVFAARTPPGRSVVFLTKNSVQEGYRTFLETALHAAATAAAGREFPALHFRAGSDVGVGAGGRVVIAETSADVAVVVDAELPVDETEAVMALHGAPDVTVYCGPMGNLLSDKRCLGWLSEDAASGAGLTDEEARVVAAALPETREVRPGPVSWRCAATRMEELLERARESLVLKPADAKGGKGVCVGVGATTAEWAEKVREALGGGWVVQERVAGVPRPMQRGDDGVADHELAWGCFLLEGRPAGLYVRSMPRDRGLVVNVAAGAESVLTFRVDEPVEGR